MGEMNDEMEVKDTEVQNENNDEKKYGELDARLLHKEDAYAMVQEVGDAVEKAHLLCMQLDSGTLDYDKMVTALNDVVNVLTSGRFREYGRRNFWLKTHMDEFLMKGSEDQTDEDRQALMELYYVATGHKAILDELCQDLIWLSGEPLKTMCKISCFAAKMKQTYGSEVIKLIDYAFEQYEQLYDYWNSAKIYVGLGTRKSNSYEENYDICYAALDDVLTRKPDRPLYRFLNSTRQPAAEGVNLFHCIDRDTREYGSYGGGTAEVYFNEAKERVGKIQDYCLKVGCKTKVKNIWEKISKLCWVMLEVFGRVYCVQKDIRENKDNIFHYPASVERVAGKLGMSLGTPSDTGTKYRDLAYAMLNALSNLCKVVAKNAAKWSVVD